MAGRPLLQVLVHQAPLQVPELPYLQDHPATELTLLAREKRSAQESKRCEKDIRITCIDSCNTNTFNNKAENTRVCTKTFISSKWYN